VKGEWRVEGGGGGEGGGRGRKEEDILVGHNFFSFTRFVKINNKLIS
jgi:hypothetical protein